MAPIVEARIRVRHRGCLSEAIVGDAHVAQISADERADILVMSGPESAVLAFVADVRATQSSPPEVVSQTPTSVIVRGRNPPSGVTATIVRAGGTILWPAVWEEGVERYTVLVPSRSALGVVLDALRPLGEVAVERLADVSPRSLPVSLPIADLTGGLTRRQAEAFRLAARAGYFETPRRIGAKELSKAAGLSRSTFEEHLRKASTHVLRQVAFLMGEHAALAENATKRPGRPRKPPAGPRAR